MVWSGTTDSDLEKDAGEEVHAGDSNNEQPRDLEYRRSKVHYSIVFSGPAQQGACISAAQRVPVSITNDCSSGH
jgi:hypothetical protein